MLIAQYRRVLTHLRATVRPRIEPLPSRMLLSVTPVGAEQLINQTTSDFQQGADIAIGAAGGVVVWQSANQNGAGWDIYARRADTDGAPSGSEILVNATTAGDQTNPAVGIDSSGRFIVTWLDNGDVYARLFGASDSPLTGNISVNDSLAGTQANPDVAMNAAGDFIVVWNGQRVGDTDGIAARRFNSAGTALAAAFAVNTTTTGIQDKPSVAITGNGVAVVAWTDASNPLSEIRGQRISSTSTLAGGEFVIGAATSVEDNASAGMDALGNFAVAFERNMGSGRSQDIFVRRYSAAGIAQGSLTQVNTTTSQPQIDPSLAMSADGAFAITWDSQNQDGAQLGVCGQAFLSSGSTDGGEFRVNTTTGGSQKSSATAWAGNRFISVWDGAGNGDADGVFAQSFTVPDRVTVDSVSTGSAKSQLSLTVAHTTSGPNRLMLVSVATDPHGASVSSATYNGVNLTFIGAEENAGSPSRVELWALVAPATGTHNVVVNMSESNFIGIVVAVTTFTGVNQSSPLLNVATAFGRGTTASVTTASQANDLAFAAIHSHNGTSVAPGAGQTELWDVVNDQCNGGGTTSAGAASVTNSWTVNNDDWTALAVSIQASSNATSVTTLTALQDSYIQLSNPTLNYGGATSMVVDRESVDLQRALLQFDLSAIPAGSTITNAVLKVNSTQIGGSLTLQLYQLLQSWTENSVTWNQRAAGTNWSSSGGTFNATPVDSIIQAATGVHQFDLTALVRSWIDGSAQNYGVMLGSPDGGSNRTVTYFARESAAPPQLLITYTPGPNAAPVNTVPAAQTVNEDMPLVFSSANGNSISVSDADAGSAAVKITLSVSSGTLTLASATGVTFIIGDGNTDATMVFTAALATVNTALNGLQFTPNPNDSGSVTFSIASDDQGNTGSGGAKTDSDSVSITVAAVNDAPVHTVPVAQSTPEDTSLLFSTAGGNAITIADLDASRNTVSVSLSVTSGRLTLATLSGLTFTAGDGIADTAMVFTATLANANAALNGLSFSPTANYAGSAVLSISTSDLGNAGSGGALTDSDSVNINVTAVNDAPVNALPPSQSVAGGGLLNLGGSYGAPLSISDVDAGNNAVEVTLVASTGTMTLATTAGLTFTTGNGSGEGTMVFRGTVAAINAALDGMSYSPPLILLGPATIDLTTNDLGNSGAGGSKSDSDTLVVSGSASANVAPAIIAPTTQIAYEDSPLLFSSPRSNDISISDPDAGSGELLVTITASGGTLTLSNNSGLTFIIGDGVADATVRFAGTLASINDALDGLVFNPPANQSGSGSLQITVNDQGNSGAGGAQSDTATIAITVDAVNDAPVNNIPAPQSTTEDVPLIFSAANGNHISIVDIDAGSGTVELDLWATSGTVTLATSSGLSFPTGDGIDDVHVAIRGTLASINAALNGLTFTPASDFNGTASLVMVMDDLGNTGSGGALTDQNHVDIDVSAVNDAPVINVPLSDNATEDTTVAFAGGIVSITDVDAGDATIIVALSATNGRMSLSQTTGLVFSTGDGYRDAAMTFTGTLDDISAALAGLTFRASANFNGIASIGISVNDEGAFGAGGSLTDTKAFSINVAAVNDAPTLSLPPTQSIIFGASLLLASGSNNAITIADIDAGSGIVSVDLSVTHGTLTLGSDRTGLNFISGDGDPDASLTITATLARLNAALDGLTFTPDNGFSGTASLSVSVDDQGNTGIGGAKSVLGSVNINVAIDVAPTVLADPTPLAYAENDGAVPVDPSLTIVDSDSANLTGATVQLVNFVASEDVLDFTDGNGITGSFDATTGLLTLTGSASISDYQAALRSVAYRNSSFNPREAVRVIRFVVNDGTLSSAPEDRALSVTRINNSPTSTGVGDIFVHEDASTTKQDIAVTVTDPDDDAATLTFSIISNSNAALFREASLVPGTNELMLKYARDAFGSATFVVRAMDPHGAYVDMTFDVHVSAVNDAPWVTTNAGLYLSSGATGIISPDQLEITDVDNLASELACTLTALPAHGVLLRNGTAMALGDSFTQSDIEQGAISYAPEGRHAGSDSFTFTISDGAGATVGPVSFAIDLTGETVEPPPPLVVPPEGSPTPPPAIDTPPPAIVPTSTPSSVPTVTEVTTVPTTSVDDAATFSSVTSSSSGGTQGTPSGGEGAPAPTAPAPAPAPASPPAAPVAVPAPANQAVAPKLESPVRNEPAPTPPTPAPTAAIVAEPIVNPRAAEIAAAEARVAFLQTKVAAQQVAFVAAPEAALVKDLESLKETVTKETRAIPVVAGSAGVVSAGISMIYLLWTIRGGYLLASLLSSMPAWRLVDPLPILDHFEDEDEQRRRRVRDNTDDSLESLAEGGNASMNNAARSNP